MALGPSGAGANRSEGHWGHGARANRSRVALDLNGAGAVALGPTKAKWYWGQERHWGRGAGAKWHWGPERHWGRGAGAKWRWGQYIGTALGLWR